MRQKLLNLWSSLVVRFFCDIDPRDKHIGDLHSAITYLWKSIDMAEYHHEFAIIQSEIEMFRDKYSMYGFDDFNEVIKGIYEHLSDRMDSVQALWSVH